MSAEITRDKGLNRDGGAEESLLCPKLTPVVETHPTSPGQWLLTQMVIPVILRKQFAWGGNLLKDLL